VNRFSSTMVALVVVLLTGCGVTTAGLKSDPGYARLALPDYWEADAQFSLSLGPRILNTALSLDDDGDFSAEDMRKLKGIRIKKYGVDDNEDVLQDYIAKSVMQLKQDGWVQMVTLNEEDERVVIMIKYDRDQVEGMSVISMDAREASFINIIGDMDKAFFQKILSNSEVVPSIAKSAI